jgi:hypothetical protein
MTWADDDQPEREFPDLDAFVDWLAHTYRRSLDTGGRVFCADWHEHAEAVSRLQGLHEAREQLRGRPLGQSTWWLQHADPTMAALLAADGPVQRCARGHTDRLPPLPLGTART